MSQTNDILVVGKSLDDIKSDRKVDVNGWRDNAASLPVVIDGVRYDADELSQTRIAAMATAVANGRAPDTIQWRDADNVTRSLTQDDFMTLATTMMTQVQAAFQTSFTLKDDIDSAETAVDVRAVKWPSNG
ncbi:DUF4376 domain-containing protein [Salinisphaera sp. LB1]|uniref:DUF4376 domain-containing protein n=1 Tax=Salinisphaera sp. LB1 TaxID=2183911 RepID=UPI000D707EB3|nr:DUF4376 domain-containing protein [Salinisphaera sp. LB1]